MSETVPPEIVETPAPAETPVVETPIAAAEAPETPAAAEAPAETAEKPVEAPKPKADPVQRRIANMTAKLAHEAQERQRAEAAAQEAERRAAAYEAMLRQMRGEDPAPAQQAAPVTDDVIRARAAQLLQEQQFNNRLAEIDTRGRDEIGADAWEQAKQTMTALGAAGNKQFLEALAETEHPHQVFARLAEDTDDLMSLMKMSPTAMAARLGRMDAQITKQSVPLSSAPPPPSPRPRGNTTPPEPTPYTYSPNMSMKEWNAMMDKFLPPSLGGKRVRA